MSATGGATGIARRPCGTRVIHVGAPQALPIGERRKPRTVTSLIDIKEAADKVHRTYIFRTGSG